MSSENETLRPGMVRVFGPGNSVALGIGVFVGKDQSQHIQIHITGGDRFHTTVTNYRGSERYHRTLIRNLRRVLIQHDAWPYGDEGAETEEPTAEEEVE